MPMNKQERANAISKLCEASTPADTVLAKQVARTMPDFVKSLRQNIIRLNRRFNQLSGVGAAAKQTQLFATIVAETDGSLMLHDIAQLLDACLPVANDWRQPTDDVLTIPFTDADVDAYEA